MRDLRTTVEAVLLPWLLMAALVACGPGTASRAPRIGLIEEYVDPVGPQGTSRLLLYEDGGFQLRHCARDPRDSGETSELVAEGEWERSEGILLLSTADWEAMFVSAIVPVELRGRADTLRGLQWMQSSAPTPVDSCRFVPREAFANFVRPPEGSGTSSW